jgi:hypothetical protein
MIAENIYIDIYRRNIYIYIYIYTHIHIYTHMYSIISLMLISVLMQHQYARRMQVDN